MTPINRRNLLFRAMALGAAGALPGCNYDDPQHPDLADRFLHAMSGWNDRVQAALFNPNTLAPTFRPDQITRPPRFNAFYDITQAPVVDAASYKLELGGQIQDKSAWTLADLRALPQEEQITRLICVEGWRVIGQWSGVPLGHFLKRVGADTTCKYVSFKCADGYYSSIDMASAMQPQTILALDFLGEPLTPPFGAPVRLRIPTKLGFKNPKSLVHLAVTNVYTGGYWADQGYNWFSGS
ncbi:MAG: molybdopterin-binding protein [Rhodospirillales bacterium 20-64-7]|jgi:DMSO/TMAO reductase YedYZ molybdopterin-dependent catalytic subunit|nr:MAG: molybdopterin-binding protein [Rhodospirillales bacterium 20-64-7]